MANVTQPAGLEPPFAIGQEWWAAINGAHQAERPCPVCFGTLAILVTLGNGEQIGVPCDACGLGVNGPRGVIQEWDWTPGAVRFVIAKIASMHADRWFVESTTGGQEAFENLYRTEAEALAASVTKCAEQHERNMRTHQQKRRGAQKAGWSIRYHREQIQHLERQIAWHQSKIIAKPEGR